MVVQGHRAAEREAARLRLIEAEDEYRRGPAADYVARRLRDAALIEAHRAGVSSREIGELVADVSGRSLARREIIPGGLLSPEHALRASGLTAREFITAVRAAEVTIVELPDGMRAFRPEDIDRLRASA